MKNKSFQNCRFVHHAKFHCIVTTLNRLFKIEFERGGGELEKSRFYFQGQLVDQVERGKVQSKKMNFVLGGLALWMN